MSRRLEEAVERGRRVRLRHRSPVRDEETTRVVDPIAVSVADGHSYLDAWDHSVEDRRLFRLDRVIDAEVLDEPVGQRARPGAARPGRRGCSGRRRTRCSPRCGSVPRRGWVTEYYPVESAQEEDDGASR